MLTFFLEGGFVIEGAESSAHNTECSVGVTLIGGRWDVVTSYDGRLGSGAIQHGGRLKLRSEF